MAKLNLLDVAKFDGNDKVVGLIEENLTFAPEIGIFPARTIKSTSYYTVKRTGFPTVGFRNANAGVVPSKSSFARQLTECFILGGAIECDRAVLESSEDGPAALEMIEASGIMKAAMIKLGAQIWYGVTNDAAGFPGIKAITPKTAVAGSSIIVKDATGTTATTASSLYAVSFGNQNVQIVTGNNATFSLTPFRDQQITDPADSTKRLPGRVADLMAWVGLSIQNINCVGRIFNITADSGKTLSDALLADLFALFPIGYKPDALFCSRRSRAQLQKSRTVTLFGQGTGRPNQPLIAPVPTEYDGVPLYATDSILDTDAIE
jgi:hypothetical protein